MDSLILVPTALICCFIFSFTILSLFLRILYVFSILSLYFFLIFFFSSKTCLKSKSRLSFFNLPSFSNFKSAFLRQFHVSLSTVVSGLSFAKYSCILLFFHTPFPSSNAVWVPSYSLNYYNVLFLQLLHLQSVAQLNSWRTIPGCLLPSLYIPHNLSLNRLPPISLLRYTLSTSLLGCSAPCIVINFLVLLSF